MISYLNMSESGDLPQDKPIDFLRPQLLPLEAMKETESLRGLDVELVKLLNSGQVDQAILLLKSKLNQVKDDGPKMMLLTKIVSVLAIKDPPSLKELPHYFSEMLKLSQLSQEDSEKLIKALQPLLNPTQVAQPLEVSFVNMPEELRDHNDQLPIYSDSLEVVGIETDTQGNKWISVKYPVFQDRFLRLLT